MEGQGYASVCETDSVSSGSVDVGWISGGSICSGYVSLFQ